MIPAYAGSQLPFGFVWSAAKAEVTGGCPPCVLDPVHVLTNISLRVSFLCTFPAQQPGVSLDPVGVFPGLGRGSYSLPRIFLSSVRARQQRFLTVVPDLRAAPGSREKDCKGSPNRGIRTFCEKKYPPRRGQPLCPENPASSPGGYSMAPAIGTVIAAPPREKPRSFERGLDRAEG